MDCALLRNQVRHLPGTPMVELMRRLTAPVSEGFKAVKWRWIIERTFGWLGRYRRLSKDYEQSPASFLAWVRLALVAILIHRFGEN